jgi:hypothetical protein
MSTTKIQKVKKVHNFAFLRICLAWRWWLTPVILATQEAKIKRIAYLETPFTKKAGGLAQGVGPKFKPHTVKYIYIYFKLCELEYITNTRGFVVTIPCIYTVYFVQVHSLHYVLIPHPSS